MLTPARNANSRWRGSPGTSGSIGWPSGRMAHAPARSFEVMRMEETPSPARLVLALGGHGFDPQLAGVEAPGKVPQQEERFRQHMVARHGLELGNVERGKNRA